MPIFPIKNKKSKKKENEAVIYSGRASAIDTYADVAVAQKTTDLLTKLRSKRDVFDAIELLVEEHPDTSMAYEMLLSLVNQGGTIEFGANGRNTEKIKEDWDIFAQRVGKLCANGLDGVVYQLHSSDFLAGGMACEVVVSKDMSDIEDVYIINPKTLKWKLGDDKQTYIPYQKINGQEIDLSKSNFLWVPFNPKIANPNGTLLFRPAISAADMQLEFFRSSQVVLYRVGMPRYKVVIDVDKLMEIAPTEVKNDVTGKKQQEYIANATSIIRNNLSAIGVKNDFIITSDMSIDTVGVNNSAFFQGISSFGEIIDTQMMNALKVLGTLMNRHQNGGSYALGTVEFKAICAMLEPRQRAEKRMIESIARIWLQVKGYNATVKYTPNPIEWQTFKDKVEYMLKNLEYNRRGEEYGYIDADTAAKKSMGTAKAFKPAKDLYEYIKKSFSANTAESNNDETDGEQNA